MKQAKPIITILILMSICCSHSIGQPTSGIGVIGNISNNFPGIIEATPLGIKNYGASIYPAGQVNDGAKVYLGEIRPVANISMLKFQCFLISSCGVGSLAGQINSGAIVDLGGVKSGATVSL
jgi:hypothetical protein